MNSDEDPSFPFICEGPSGVLAIFEETSGVLPVMSTSAEVADLEDVFAKTSVPIQSSQSNSEEIAVIAKNSASVLSEFENTALTPPEDSKKAVEENNPSVLSDSVELVEEIQEVSIESTLAAANTGLDPVVETTKTIQEQTSAAVTGSVELAEEIMEAFANSKNVLDTENPVANDSSTLQEELDRLEQLAVERVREIEGELVSSTKQITECNLSLDTPKEPEVIEINENVQKEFESGTVSELVVPDADDVSAKEAGERLCEDVMTTIDLTSPSSDLASIDHDNHSTNAESMADSKMTQDENAPDVVLIDEKSEIIVTNTLEAKKIEIELDGKSDHTISLLKEKTDDSIVEVGESDNEISKLENKVDYTASKAEVDKVAELGKKNITISNKEIETNLSEKKYAKDSVKNSKSGESEIATAEEENNKLVEKNVKNSNNTDIEVVQTIIEEKECVSDISSTSNIISEKSCINERHLETGETTSSAQVIESKNNGKNINDIQDYETEDDDLEVLEAFIVKTATNPELAVCTVQPSKDDISSKYSLESTLLDDLTKTDGGSCANEGESKSDNVNENSSLAESSVDGTPGVTQKRASRVGSLDEKSEGPGISTACRSEKHESSLSSDTKLPEKKHLPQSSNKLVRSGSETKEIKSNVSFMETKRRRSFISSKKTLRRERSPAFLRKESNIEQGISEMSVSEKGADEENTTKDDQTPASKKSIKNSKKIKLSEENVPSTSDIVLGQEVNEHSFAQSGIGKIQKKTSEQNSNTLSSTSKSTVKSNENKREDRPGTIVKVDSSSKEKRKSKDIKSNCEEKATSGIDIKTINEKRNVENNLHSTLKSSKKEEKKVKEKENVSSRNRNIVKEASNDVTNSRATRSTKKKVTLKSPQSSKLNEHTKVKNKENVEKFTHSVTGNGGVKRRTEKTVNKETSLKGEKNYKGQQEMGLLEGERDTKNKGKEIPQQSAVVKPNKGDKGIDSLPKTRASASILNREEKGAERNLPKQKVSSNALKQKRTEDENLSDSTISGTVMKRKKVDKDENLSDLISGTVKKRKKVDKDENLSALPISDTVMKRKKVDKVENLPDVPISGTVMKRKKVDKETDDGLTDAQHSPTAAKYKRAALELKESSSEIQIPLSTLKQKDNETETKESTNAEQLSPTTLKRRRVEREFEQSLAQFTIVNQNDSNSSMRNMRRIPNVYTHCLFIEFEDITFEMLASKAKQLVLPTSLWGAQVSLKKDLVAFSRLSADLSDGKPMIDKALVFQGSLKPVALINNEPINLPIPSVRTFEDVVMLIQNFHTVSFCEGTGVKQRPHSKFCFRYLDVANPGARCSQCLEERRRVLFGCIRKLRERINVMKAAKSGQ